MAHRVPKQPAVSVVMTVLDNGDEIARAVESVLNQSFGDLELLCVCGPDAAGARRVCDRFAERDIRVEVLSCPEGGVAGMRNEALDRARGRSVMFCEGDGWFAPGAFEELMRLAEEAGDDGLAMAGVFADTYRGRSRERRSRAVLSEQSGLLARDAFRAAAGALVESDLLCSLWGKVLPMGRIAELGLRFEGAVRSEVPFIVTLLRDAERVGVSGHALYHHTLPDGPSAPVFSPESFERYSAEYELLLGLWERWGLSYDRVGLDAVHHRYIDQVVSCIEGICSRSCTLSPIEKRDRIRDLVCAASTRSAAALSASNASVLRPLVESVRKGRPDACYMEGRLLNLFGRTSRPSQLVESVR